MWWLQVINIVTLGSPVGKGVFFPNGLLGEIVTPYGYNMTDPGNKTFPSGLSNNAILDTQVSPSVMIGICLVMEAFLKPT